MQAAPAVVLRWIQQFQQLEGRPPTESELPANLSEARGTFVLAVLPRQLLQLTAK